MVSPNRYQQLKYSLLSHESLFHEAFSSNIGQHLLFLPAPQFFFLKKKKKTKKPNLLFPKCSANSQEP